MNMEENQAQQSNEATQETKVEDETVPIEQVNKVIAQANPNEGEVIDLTSEEVKEEEKFQEELENPTEQATTEVPDIEPKAEPEGTSGTDQLTQQAAPIKQTPSDQEPIKMNFLQFQCEDPKCQFKTYINIEDDKVKELPDKVKCMNCQKKKSVRKRVMEITLHNFVDYIEPPSPDMPTLPAE